MASDSTKDWRQSPPAPWGHLVGELVFGVNDGLVSVTGLVMGVAASNMQHSHVLTSGLAATAAATVAMGLGAYLATTAENAYRLSDLSSRLGAGNSLPPVPSTHQAAWIRSSERLPLPRAQGTSSPGLKDAGMRAPLSNPWRSALLMAVSVLMGSLPPIIPLLLIAHVSAALPWSIFLAMLAAFGLGMVKAYATQTPVAKSGLQFLGVIALAVLWGLAAGKLIRVLL